VVIPQSRDMPVELPEMGLLVTLLLAGAAALALLV
jgi:hypothetical protein